MLNGHTCLATMDRFLTLPVLSNSRTVPLGASSAVAVVIVTASQSEHNEARASPLNPNVVIDVKSVNSLSLEVWCFNPCK